MLPLRSDENMKYSLTIRATLHYACHGTSSFTYLFCCNITCAGTQLPVCVIQQNLYDLKTKTKLMIKDSEKQFNTLVSKFGHKQHA